MKTQAIQNILDELNSRANIQSSALVSVDGLVLASALGAGLDADIAGAMSAAILSVGKKACKELKYGSIEQVFIQANEGCFTLSEVGNDAILIVLASRNTKIGVLLTEIKQSVVQLAESIY